MARLFVDGKDHGPHPFLVQIRNVTDHQPLPGIEVGDIGPKFGFMAVDNGFLRFGASLGPVGALLRNTPARMLTRPAFAVLFGRGPRQTMCASRARPC